MCMWAIHKDPLLKKTEKSKHHACHLYVLQKKSCYRETWRPDAVIYAHVHSWLHRRAWNNLHATTAVQNPNAHSSPLHHIWCNQAEIPGALQDPYSLGFLQYLVLNQKWLIFSQVCQLPTQHISREFEYILLRKYQFFFHKFFAGHSLNISWFLMTFAARLDRSKMTQTKHISKTLCFKYPNMCTNTQGSNIKFSKEYKKKLQRSNMICPYGGQGSELVHGGKV